MRSGHAAVEAHHLKTRRPRLATDAALSNLTMNTKSVADLVYEVNVKTQSVALCAPSFEAALNSTTTTGITAGFRPSYEQRELPTEKGKEVGAGGFVWLSNNVLSLVERLPRKSRPSVRSVLLAYAQLSSRRGNAKTFPAAAELVARMAGCAIRTVHNADKHLVTAGLLTISRQRLQGRDVPRLVTLVEVAAAPPIPFEVVSVDDLPGVREHRRQQSKRSVHTGMQVVQCNLHTLKKHSEERIQTDIDTSLSLSPRKQGQRPRRERETWEACEARLAREHGVDLERIQTLRREHASRLAKLPSGAWQTVTNFSNALPTLLEKPNTKTSKLDYVPTPEKAKAAMTKAMVARVEWWYRFAATKPDCASSYDKADEETRFQFMTSDQGRSFATFAERFSRNGSYFKFNEETGRIDGHGLVFDGGDW